MLIIAFACCFVLQTISVLSELAVKYNTIQNDVRGGNFGILNGRVKVFDLEDTMIVSDPKWIKQYINSLPDTVSDEH